MSDKKIKTTEVMYPAGKPPTIHICRCRLSVENRDGSATEYVFDQDLITTGSSDENDIVINDGSVSRSHFRIVHEGGNYLVQDLNSTNGTFVDRVRVREAFLKNGSVITAGRTRIKFASFGEYVEITPHYSFSIGDVVGRSLKMREIFGIVEKIAPTNATVIIEGETGVGKEVVARALHQKSLRAKEPFIVFDCGAVPKDLIESELFGHERGSFTGAYMARQGLFEMANGGTLFLDEIGELTPELQPKLLRAIEHREIRRVGSNRSVKVDVRLIAATNKNLDEEVKGGRFREDLFYRLSVVKILIPPLRERLEDIPLLVRHFLKNGAFNRDAENNQRVKGIDEDALNFLMSYYWPGNVRELLNVIERACSFCDGEFIGAGDLPAHLATFISRSAKGKEERRDTTEEVLKPASSGGFKEAKDKWVERFESEYILSLMKKHNMKIAPAAREAGIDRKYFRKLVKKHNIITDDGEKL